MGKEIHDNDAKGTMSRISDIAYGSLAAVGLPRLHRRNKRSAVVFTFHNVVHDVDESCADASLHVGVSSFARYVDWIADTYEVIHAAELIKRIESQRSVQGLSAITFDDAYLGVHKFALPILRTKGLPATVFVISRAADRPAAFWWDELASLGVLNESLRNRCVDEFAGDGNEIKASVGYEAPTLPEELNSASWREIEEVASESVVFGSHSATHRNLTRLNQEELLIELNISRESVMNRLGLEPELIAYPYGLHSEPVIREVANLGFRGGFTTLRGLVDLGAQKYLIQRVNVPAGISLAALECRAAGIRFR